VFDTCAGLCLLASSLIWRKGEHAMLGAAIVIPGIIVLILVILIIIYFVRRA
jgi:hypothetical protein